MAAMTGPSSSPAAPQRGWSKQNLRAGERTGWTRGQDGGAGGGGSAVDGVGQVRSVSFPLYTPHVRRCAAPFSFVGYESTLTPCHAAPRLTHLYLDYSSNLTFSLAPGWAFVETEDWRKDVQCAWAPCGGDPGAFAYLYPSPHTCLFGKVYCPG